MIATLLWAAVLSADPAPNPTPDQVELLTIFRREFVTITPGRGRFPQRFQMGRSQGGDDSERPSREVTLSADFEIARYEVPQNLWEAVLGSNPSRWKGPRNSVEMVSFDECVRFCRRATELMRAARLIDGEHEIRLPSEAEWEYCARAGTTTVYSFGDDSAQLDRHAWYAGNAAGNDPPVGAKQPNPWGLYDIHGYLWEWCADHGHADYRDAPPDGSAWLGGDERQRVIRGGSWKDAAELLTSSCRGGSFRHAGPLARDGRITFRGGVDKRLRDDAVGLRCVLARRP